MTLERIKTAIAQKKMRCPSCGEPVLKHDKYIESVDSIWDGFGDSRVQYGNGIVTLICGNGNCSWQERTEYWLNYIED